MYKFKDDILSIPPGRPSCLFTTQFPHDNCCQVLNQNYFVEIIIAQSRVLQLCGGYLLQQAGGNYQFINVMVCHWMLPQIVHNKKLYSPYRYRKYIIVICMLHGYTNFINPKARGCSALRVYKICIPTKLAYNCLFIL